MTSVKVHAFRESLVRMGFMVLPRLCGISLVCSFSPPPPFQAAVQTSHRHSPRGTRLGFQAVRRQADGPVYLRSV